MSDFPIVTVLICTYNGQKYIEEQLKSIINQTYKNIEIFVLDDRSTDNTYDILLGMIKYASKKYVKMSVSQTSKNTGSASESFKYLLLNHLDKKIIMFSDQDDVWKENKVEIMYHKLSKKDNQVLPCLVTHNQIITDEELKYITSTNRVSKDFNDLVFSPNIPGCTIMINQVLIKNLKDKIPTYWYMHDWYISMLCTYLDGKIIVIEDYLSYYRQHSDNEVGYNQLTFTQSALENVRFKKKSTAYSNYLYQLYCLLSVVDNSIDKKDDFRSRFIKYYNKNSKISLLILLIKKKIILLNFRGLYQAGIILFSKLKLRGLNYE